MSTEIHPHHAATPLHPCAPPNFVSVEAFYAPKKPHMRGATKPKKAFSKEAEIARFLDNLNKYKYLRHLLVCDNKTLIFCASFVL